MIGVYKDERLERVLFFTQNIAKIYHTTLS